MLIRSRDEIMEQLRVVIGENDDDNVLTLLEDISDTLSSANPERIKELEDRIVNVEKEWRGKYRDAFFSGGEKIEELEETEVKKPRTYEDLFTTN